jgi:hypothetical protein
MEAEPEKSAASSRPVAGNEPNFNRPARPIAELVVADDFPRCALGELVDIGGYTGVVADIVNQSLKVRSPEGRTKSFNVGGLRRIYAPHVPPPPIAAPPAVEASPPRPAPEQPPTVLKPDFSKPVKPISAYVKRPNYPQCLLGEHVQIADYSGVVVQIVNRSLKVRSPAEVTRSYNADALRRLHAGG